MVVSGVNFTRQSRYAMKFSKTPPPRKRKHYSNAVTDDPAFVQLLKAMHRGTPRAALSFDLNEAEKLKIAHPWRVGSGRPAQDH